MAKKKISPKGYTVFISYSTKDRWIAQQIDRLIREKGRGLGVNTFLYEKGTIIGDPITQTVRDNIDNCSEFLVFLSQNSIKSEWVLMEMGAAWGLKKQLTAIMYNVTPKDLPQIIAEYAGISLNEFDKYLEQFYKRLKEASK